MRQASFLMAIPVLCLALLSACAPSPAPPGPSPAPVPGSGPSPSSAPAVPPEPGGSIRFPNTVAPAGFDLHRKPAYGPNFSMMVFNNLVRFDPGKPDVIQENIVPDLAERFSVSPDGLVWTFNLRRGVKWHDGKTFDAEDVAYSVQKWMDPKRSVLDASFPVFDRVEKVDDFTVRIYTKQPSPAFLLQLAGAYAVIQGKHTGGVDQRSADFLMGTGPFKLKLATPGVSYEYTRNPDYFKKGLPYLDGLTAYVMTDSYAHLDALATGRLDMLQPQGGVSGEDLYFKFMTLAKDNLKDYVLEPYGGPGPMLWLNTQYEPLKDQRVRRALTLVTDGKEVTIAGLGAERWGRYDIALFGKAGLSQAELDALLGRDKPYDQRVAEAKKLMAEAGYAQGFKLRIAFGSAFTVYQKRAAYLADIYKRHLNIDAQMTPLESSVLRQAIDGKDFHMYIAQIVNSLADPDEVMPYFRTGGPVNYSSYSNPSVDKLWDEQSRTMDPAKRRQLVQQIERQVLADLPLIPTAGNVNIVIWQAKVHYQVQNVFPASSITFEQAWRSK